MNISATRWRKWVSSTFHSSFCAFSPTSFLCISYLGGGLVLSELYLPLVGCSYFLFFFILLIQWWGRCWQSVNPSSSWEMSRLRLRNSLKVRHLCIKDKKGLAVYVPSITGSQVVNKMHQATCRFQKVTLWKYNQLIEVILNI